VLGDTEVKKLRIQRRRCSVAWDQEDVPRLEIAMDDTHLVGTVECGGDLYGVADRLIDRQRSAREPRRERLTLEKLHHEITNRHSSAIVSPRFGGRHCGFADIVEHADVRMVQRGDRARFSIETFASVHIVGHMRRQHFDGHGTAKPCVACRVDLPHSASANPGAEPVWSDLNSLESRGDSKIGDRDGRRHPEEVVGLVMRREHALTSCRMSSRSAHASAT
jgi:hypothetical protein